MKIFFNDRFRVYFKSAVEQISLEFAEFKLNGNIIINLCNKTAFNDESL